MISLIIILSLYLLTLFPLFLIFNINETIICALLIQFILVLAANIFNFSYIEKKLNYTSPFLIMSFLYLMAYHFSTIYFIFLPEHFSANIDFNFNNYDSVKSSLTISIISYLSIASGYFIAFFLFPKLNTESAIKKLNYKFSYLLFFCWLALVIVKLIYLKLGWYGSLAAFTESNQSAGMYTLITPFFLYVYPYIAYLSVIACNNRSGLKFLVIVIAIELIVAIIAGNRRELITLLFPVFIIYYSFGMLRLNFLKTIGLTIFILSYLIIVNTYGRILGNIGSMDVDYYILFINAYELIPIYFVETINFIFAEIFSWIGQLHLIGTVIASNIEDYGLLSPFKDLLSRFITFDTNLPNVEYDIFMQTLFIKGEKPYLTNPSTAYLYYLAGLPGVILYGFLSGILFRSIIVYGLKHKFISLLVLGFFFTICSIPLQSLVGAFIGIIKVSIFAIILYLLIGLISNAQKNTHIHSLF